MLKVTVDYESHSTQYVVDALIFGADDAVITESSTPANKTLFLPSKGWNSVEVEKNARREQPGEHPPI